MANTQLSVFDAKGLAFRLFLEVPERPADVARRHHNRFAKNAMSEVLDYHHEHHIPQHYKGDVSARKYNYAPRSAAYNKAKMRMFRHAYPLVYTGKTSQQHKQPGGYKRKRVGGAAEGGKRALSGSLEYEFSFSEKIRDHMRAKFAAAGAGKPPSEARKARMAQRKARTDALKQDARRRGVTIGQMRKELEQMTQQEVSKLAEVFLQSYMRQYNEMKSTRKRVRLPKS